ncbi:MFS general substrate transporter [Aspergillus egyptiacus]|nr:MFS general substrate transporter [Aspergillus egyptiacus]
MEISEKSFIKQNAPESTQSSSATPSPSPGNESPPSLLTLIQQSRKTVAWCLALTSGILLYGYDLVIVGNVSSMPEFQKQFGHHHTTTNQLIIPSLWLSLWNISNSLGGILGALTGGHLQDLTGRRATLLTASTVSALAVAIAYVADLPASITTRRAVFFTTKFLQGFAVNMVMCTTQTYMSEILPDGLRGPVFSFVPVFTLLGQLVGGVVVYAQLKEDGATGYRNCFVSEWAFSVVAFAVAVCMPESPVYLVRRGEGVKARGCLRRLLLLGSGEGHEAEVEVERAYERIRVSVEKKNSTNANAKTGYLECFRGTDRRRTTIVLFAGVLPPLFGLTLLAKGSYFMQVVDMSAHHSLVFLQVGIALGIVANLGSMGTLARFGRVGLTVFGLGGCAFLWMGMGIAGCFSGGGTVWYTQASILLIVTIAGLSTWPASHAIGAEASSLHLRAKAQGLGWLANCLANGVMGFVLPYIFNPDEGALGAKTGFVYAGLCIVALVVTVGIVPEMKDRSALEIDRMFEEGGEGRRRRRWLKRWNWVRDIAGGGDAEGGTGRARPNS